MLRPDTIIVWNDQSGISRDIAPEVVSPTFLMGISADKGPEEMMIVNADSFYKNFGTDISYEKHGQPLVQAAHIVDNGGKILIKRVVAPDATLANLSVIAYVETIQTQKVNENGEKLYIDATTEQETTEADGNEAAMINSASIKYDMVSVPNVKTMEKVKEEISKLVDDAGTDGTSCYPLITVTDNGRGASIKRFNITPDYTVSKSLNFQYYYLNCIGNTDIDTENCRFGIAHDVVYLDNSISLTMTSKSALKQIKAVMHEDFVDQFIAKVADATGLTVDYLKTVDVMFGCNRKGEPLSQISIDEEGYNLSESLGVTLQSGTNGSFGDKPFDTADYSKELVKFFNGEFDDNIFDVNRYTIDAALDANYPLEVKESIVALANFREDFFFFRDIGLEKETFDQIIAAAAEQTKTKFAGTYITSYDVIDPYTRKQIPVTMLYSLAVKLIDHFNLRRNNAVCGIQFGFQFPEAIEGTVNFCPKVTPKVDQKTLLLDNMLNYASYIGNTLTLETTLTSQDPYTQLSFINNVLAVQEVIHAVRQNCPSFRYSFITSDDLDTYRKDVNDVLSQFKENFASLEFEYTQDKVMAANKIFNASIKVTFMNFVQTEYFTIYALESE